VRPARRLKLPLREPRLRPKSLIFFGVGPMKIPAAARLGEIGALTKKSVAG
jgi:hypothetical protein